MMKRSTRAIDVPKLRRSLKGRGRIAETMYYGLVNIKVVDADSDITSEYIMIRLSSFRLAYNFLSVSF